jgi:sugar (pentulose or hexulose) kinase
MAAAIGVGLCSDYTAAAPLFCPTAAREDPDAEAVEAYARAMPRFQRLYQALKESFRESAET